MARLNEAPPSNDALENLRKKFLRQNRDIARDNSAKSLRIRALENEVARLLSENLGLSEAIVHLESEVSVSKNRRIIDHVTSTRSKLETKLDEIAVLIAGITHVPSAKRRVSQRDQQKCEGVTSPNQRKWKEGVSLDRELREGMLPPILEDKQYPRKTLNQEELKNLLATDTTKDSTDSPDIGPPPISVFTNQDPVTIDLLGQRTPSGDEDSVSDTGCKPILSVNLEQRRKRKEIMQVHESSQSNEDDQALEQERRQESIKTVPQLLKTGAKRKLNVREDDDSIQRQSDAAFSRTANEIPIAITPRELDDNPLDNVNALPNKVIRDPTVARNIVRPKKVPNVATITPRKVLGSKAALDLAQSPKKQIKGALKDEIAAVKSDLVEAKTDHEQKAPRPRGPTPVLIPATSQPIPSTIELDEGEPRAERHTETVISVPDLNSSISTLTSTKPSSRDTPPPLEMEVDAEANRPSRRARAAVSYAEPNLRDKMRRPTKELVAAVRERKTREVIDLDRPMTMIKSPATLIKEEHNDDDETWRNARNKQQSYYASSPSISKVAALRPYCSTNRESPSRLTVLDSTIEAEPMKELATSNGKTELANDMEDNHGLDNTVAGPLFADLALNIPSQVTDDRSPTPSESASLKNGRSVRGASQSASSMAVLDPSSKIKPMASSRRRQSALGLESIRRTGTQTRAPVPENGMKRANSTSSMTEVSRKEPFLTSSSTNASAISTMSDGSRTERAGRRRSMML